MNELASFVRAVIGLGAALLLLLACSFVWGNAWYGGPSTALKPPPPEVVIDAPTPDLTAIAILNLDWTK